MDKLKYICTGDFHPKRGSEHAAGIDLYNNDTDILLLRGEKIFLDTKTSFEIPEGYVGLVFPRSGLGSKGLRLANSVGVIDSDYRGSIKAMLEYNGEEPLEISMGTRFAQMVVIPYFYSSLESVKELSDTVRGEGGFGSTGTK